MPAYVHCKNEKKLKQNYSHFKCLCNKGWCIFSTTELSRLLSMAAWCKFHILELKEEKILFVEDQVPIEMLI